MSDTVSTVMLCILGPTLAGAFIGLNILLWGCIIPELLDDRRERLAKKAKR